MLPFIFEMKIIKYTFKIPQLTLENGELKEEGSKEETYTFTLLHKGIGLYEEMAGEPLINTLLDVQNLKENEIAKIVMNSKFVLNLASASYVKIEDGKFHNNRATCEEFKKLPVCNHLNDPQFVAKLLEMATECVVGDLKQNPKSISKSKKETEKK